MQSIEAFRSTAEPIITHFDSEKAKPQKAKWKLNDAMPILRRAIVQGRFLILVMLHLLCFVTSYLLALLIRFEFAPPEAFVSVFWNTLPLILGVKLATFYLSSNFNGWLRYVTFADLKALFRAALIAEGGILAIDVLWLHSLHIPRCTRPAVTYALYSYAANILP